MNKTWWILILIGFTSIINGQSRFGDKISDSLIYSKTSISNILYKGIDNYLYINEALYKPYDTIIIHSNNGRVFFDEDYFLIPIRSGNLRVEIHGITNGSTDTLGYFNFKVNNLPSPRITFNNSYIQNDSIASLNAFLQADSIYLSFTDDLIGSENWIQIREFSIACSYGGMTKEVTSINNEITNEMKSVIASYGRGKSYSIKIITHSTPTMLLIKPIYRFKFY